MTNSQFQNVFCNLPSPKLFHEAWKGEDTFLDYFADFVAKRIVEETGAVLVPRSARYKNCQDLRQIPHLYPETSIPHVLRQPFGKLSTLDTVYLKDGKMLAIENQRGVKGGNIPNVWANLLHPGYLYMFANPGKYFRVFHGIDLWKQGGKYETANRRFHKFLDDSEDRLNRIYPEGFADGFRPARLQLRHAAPRMREQETKDLEDTFKKTVEDGNSGSYFIKYGKAWPPSRT